MNFKYKRLILCWLGIGMMLTCFLYVLQENHNSKYKFVPNNPTEIFRKKGLRNISEKRFTYYELCGAITLGGALVILGMGIKENN
ncbi:hypothetical protein [Aequorivita capsosiphonis]|uniref:hypothetical protein n=1 Tax=Aequorivita capsosiphonis TaxID=487317 RepID=UPI000401C49D|nr:hypothetical protein [Aequorivita capsosiphonis]